MILKPCGYPGCGVASPEARCEAHKWKGDHRTTKQKGYCGATWSRLRAQTLRKHPVCVVCRERVSVVADHIVPKKRGGKDEAANLQGLCLRCHGEKTRRGD